MTLKAYTLAVNKIPALHSLAFMHQQCGFLIFFNDWVAVLSGCMANVEPEHNALDAAERWWQQARGRYATQTNEV